MSETHIPEEALVPRCPSCGHFARHHESYPYLDGVLCKTRKNKTWCDCSLTVDQVTEALITEAQRDASARAAQVVRDASEQDSSRGGLVRHWMLRLADEIEAGAGYIREESPDAKKLIVVTLRGGPFDGQQQTVTQCLPMFPFDDGQYWLDTKSDPPEYFWNPRNRDEQERPS